MKRSEILEQNSAKDTNIRVSNVVKEKFSSLLDRVNQKDFGRKIKPSELVSIAITLVKEEHIKNLQDATLSNQDRVEIEYQKYLKVHPDKSRDEFFGLLLSGALKSNTSAVKIDLKQGT